MKHRICILAIMGLVMVSCKKQEETSPIIQDIKELVFASGDLEWDNSYNLTAQTDGILTQANFDIGDRISKSNVLAIIHNPVNSINVQSAKEQLSISQENLTDQSPALQQLQQNIQSAQNKYNQDKLQAERYQRLYDLQSVAKLEYENAQLAAKNSLYQLNALKKQYNQVQQQARQQYISAENQLANSQVVQNYNRLVASEGGKVIKKLKSNGDYVRKGDVVAVIADDSQVELVLNVDENNIGKVKVGQMVWVKLNTDKTIHPAKITEILSAFDETTQSFICKAQFKNPLSVTLYGTQLEANILVGEKKNALLIPRKYLGYGNAVKIKGDDKETKIQIGIISSDYVEVLSGVTTKDVLISLNP